MELYQKIIAGGFVVAWSLGLFGCNQKVEKTVLMNPQMYRDVEVSNPKQTLPINIFLPVDDTQVIGKIVTYKGDEHPRVVSIKGGLYSIAGVGCDYNGDGHFETLVNNGPKYHSMGQLEKELMAVKLKAITQ